MKISTLEEFRSSRKEMTWHDCAELLKIDKGYTDAPKVQVYLDRFYIEDYGYKGYDDGHNPVCQYVLVVARDVRYSNDLLTLEQILYEYLRDEEYL